jgi:putative thioredoxin
VDVRAADFESRVIRQSFETLVVVDFWAPWCGPCRMLTPLLEKVVGENRDDVVLAKINTDEEQELAAQFRIEVLPTVLVFREGQIVFQFQGLVMEPQLREMIGRLLPTEAEHLVKKAARVEEKEPAQAEALYRKALEQDNRLDAAAVGLARVLVWQNRDDEARKALDNIVAGGELAKEVERLGSLVALRQAARDAGDEAAVRQALRADPNNAENHYRLGCILAAKGDYQHALEELLAAGERDYKLLTSRVRETMVQIFHVIGNQSPLANEFRGRLSSLLY